MCISSKKIVEEIKGNKVKIRYCKRNKDIVRSFQALDAVYWALVTGRDWNIATSLDQRRFDDTYYNF